MVYVKELSDRLILRFPGYSLLQCIKYAKKLNQEISSLLGLDWKKEMELLMKSTVGFGFLSSFFQDRLDCA